MDGQSGLIGHLWRACRTMALGMGARRGATFLYAAVLAGAASTWTLHSQTGVLLYTSPPASVTTVTRTVDSRDDTPARVLVVPRRGLLPGTLVTSNIIRLSGITVPVGVAVDPGVELSIDGQGWVSGPVAVERGVPIQLRAPAPPAGQTVTVTLTTGTVASAWTLTSLDAAADSHQTLYGPWGACDTALPCAGQGSQSREILCLRSDGRFVAVTNCAAGLSATETRGCPSPAGQAPCLAPPAGSQGWTQYCAAGSTVRGACTGNSCSDRFTLEGASCVQSVFDACAANTAGDGSWTHAQLPHGGFAVPASRATPDGALPAFAIASRDETSVSCEDGIASVAAVTTTATACVASHKVLNGQCVAKSACAANSAPGGWSHAGLAHAATPVGASRATPAANRPTGAAAATDTGTVSCDDGAATGTVTGTTIDTCLSGWTRLGNSCIANVPGTSVTLTAPDPWVNPQAPVGTIIGTLVTNDPDTAAGAITYWLDAGADGYVRVDAATRTLQIAQSPLPLGGGSHPAPKIWASDGVSTWSAFVPFKVGYVINDFASYSAFSGFPPPTSCRGYLDAYDDAAGTGNDPSKFGRPGDVPAHSRAYRIDPDGAGGGGTIDVYCDMHSDGGGWTLAAKIHNGSTSAHRTASAVTPGNLTTPTHSTTAKLSDADINRLRGSTYVNSILRTNSADGKADYFREGRAFNANGNTNSINRVFNTYSDALNQSGGCNGIYNSTIHTGLVGWGCYDHFLYGDNPGFRTQVYQGGWVYVKQL